MKFQAELKGDILVVRLSGKIMASSDNKKFHDAIKELIARGHRKFLLDFSGVDWINSTGIGLLLSANHSIRTAEGRMKICGANERVRGIYYVSQLDKIFEFHDTLGDALGSLGASSAEG